MAAPPPGASYSTDVIALVFSGGSLIVSGIAGWTAHQARKWQRERDDERRAVRLRIDVVQSWRHVRPGTDDAVYAFPASTADYPNDMLMIYTMSLTVINDGELPEYITEATVRDLKGKVDWELFRRGREPTEPLAVPSRGTVTTPTVDLPKHVVAYFRANGFVAVVRVGLGEVVSDPSR